MRRAGGEEGEGWGRRKSEAGRGGQRSEQSRERERDRT